MLDISNIPFSGDNVRIFYATDTNTWQTWIKPKGCNYIWIMCIGGASGGYGGSNSAGFNGGTGGGSGGVTRALFPASVLPDILLTQPGPGGASVAGGAVANSGNRSWVAISPVTSSAMNVICVSGTAAASFGTGETAATTTIAGLLNLGIFNVTAGVTSGGNTTPLTGTITCPGCLGGSSSAGLESGFSILSTPLSQTIVGATTTSVNGGDGIWSWKPMFGIGGAGGCGSTTGTIGSNGGNGAYGCGGGGGGSSGAGGGRGGKGGDGLVIIATF